MEENELIEDDAIYIPCSNCTFCLEVNLGSETSSFSVVNTVAVIYRSIHLEPCLKTTLFLGQIFAN